MAEQGRVESVKDFGDEGGAAVVARWKAEIKAYEDAFGKWERKAGRIVKRFRDESNEDDSHIDRSPRFNILWSNVRTLQPVLYANPPVPVARRRVRDRDPVSRAASEILERVIAYEIEEYDFDVTVKASRDDYLLAGRGTVWERYVPVYGDEETPEFPVQIAGGQDGSVRYTDDEDTEYKPESVIERDGQYFGKGESFRPVVHEYVVCDYVHYADFGHTPAPCWEKVRAVWRKTQMTRAQLKERFPKVGDKVPLSAKVENVSEQVAATFPDVFKRAIVYEIWDKDAREAVWVCPDFGEGPLDRLKDPLRLQGFFPCPRPLFDTMTGDTLVPVPEYSEYEYQADEVDDLTGRIDQLVSVIRLAGVYNGNFPELADLAKGGDNVLLPIDDWPTFAGAGGLEGMVDFLPLKEMFEVLKGLYEARQIAKEDLYEITGLSDIIRGASDPDETATAQRIKGRFAGLRLEERQKEVQRFIRDILRIKAEIAAEHFSDETLAEISGWLQGPQAEEYRQKRQAAEQQVMQAIQQGRMPQMQQMPPAPEDIFQQAVQLLRDDRMRSFRVDVETESTIAVDEEAEKRSAVEFLGAVGPFMSEALPAVEKYPSMAPLMGQMLMLAVRRFRAGREIEGFFDDFLDQIKTGQLQPPPDPRAEAEKAKAEVAQGQLQIDGENAKTDRMRAGTEARQAEAEIAAQQAELAGEQQDRAIEARVAAGQEELKRVELAQSGMALRMELARLLMGENTEKAA